MAFEGSVRIQWAQVTPLVLGLKLANPHPKVLAAFVTRPRMKNGCLVSFCFPSYFDRVQTILRAICEKL